MLVLTRKVQEQIKIGDNITVTIVRVKGQSVRVGIEAPFDVRVMRAELTAFQSDDEVANPPAEKPAAKPQNRLERIDRPAPQPTQTQMQAPAPLAGRLPRMQPALAAALASLR